MVSKTVFLISFVFAILGVFLFLELGNVSEIFNPYAFWLAGLILALMALLYSYFKHSVIVVYGLFALGLNIFLLVAPMLLILVYGVPVQD